MGWRRSVPNRFTSGAVMCFPPSQVRSGHRQVSRGRRRADVMNGFDYHTVRRASYSGQTGRARICCEMSPSSTPSTSWSSRPSRSGRSPKS